VNDSADRAELLQGALIAVVASDAAACERRAAPLRRAGAVVQTAIAQVNGLALLSAAAFDGAILDVGEEPEAFVILAASIREDARTRALPILTVAGHGVTAARLAQLGSVQVGVDGDDDALTAQVADLVLPRQTEARAAEYVRALEERLRVAQERLTAMRSDSQTIAHDARVLCGIVVGYAANLRDGIAGPLGPMQRDHVARILEAVNDTTALVDRFGAAARAQTDLPTDRASLLPAGRRTHRRTLVDLVELVASTAQLFKRMGEEKSVRIDIEAAAPVPVWCDAMQVKQVVTNLLVNAIKFSPARGRVLAAVRAVAPPGAAVGPGARTSAELVVCDEGPGIPEGDRQRVFERGFRLDRDRRVAGSGIGLAVVREIILAHRGSVHATEAPGGGAALVVRLPLDVRTRRDSNGQAITPPAEEGQR
jgi:signal transduction histidine kinase